jgi:hypothetical protein
MEPRSDNWRAPTAHNQPKTGSDSSRPADIVFPSDNGLIRRDTLNRATGLPVGPSSLSLKSGGRGNEFPESTAEKRVAERHS